MPILLFDDDLPPLSVAVEATLKSRLGCVVTNIRSDRVLQEKPETSGRKLKRKYVKHLLRAGAQVNRDLMVFTKTGRRVASHPMQDAPDAVIEVCGLASGTTPGCIAQTGNGLKARSDLAIL